MNSPQRIATYARVSTKDKDQTPETQLQPCGNTWPDEGGLSLGLGIRPLTFPSDTFGTLHEVAVGAAR